MFFSLVVSFLSPSACFWFCRFPRWKAFATLTSEWPGRGADKTASTFPALVQTKAFPPPEGSSQRVLPRQTTISLLNREDQAVFLFLSFFPVGAQIGRSVGFELLRNVSFLSRVHFFIPDGSRQECRSSAQLEPVCSNAWTGTEGKRWRTTRRLREQIQQKKKGTRHKTVPNTASPGKL